MGEGLLVLCAASFLFSACRVPGEPTAGSTTDHASYVNVPTADLVMSAAQLQRVTKLYPTDRVVADRAGFTGLLATDYDRYPDDIESQVSGRSFTISEEVTRSDSDEGAMDFLKDTNAREFSHANDNAIGEWVDLAIARLDPSHLVCGSPGGDAECHSWTWEGRYGQYVVRLIVVSRTQSLSRARVEALARATAEREGWGRSVRRGRRGVP